MKYFIFVISVITLALAGCGHSKKTSIADSISFEIKDTSRQFTFTNKKYGQYYGQTNNYFDDGWMGWTLREQRVFNDYSLTVKGFKLQRNLSTSTVSPYQIERTYANGLKERFFFADSLDAIIIELEGAGSGEVCFSIDNIALGGTPQLKNNYVLYGLSQIISNYNLYVTSDANIKDFQMQNGSLQLFLEGTDKIKIMLLASDKKENLKSIFDNSALLIAQKKARIEKMLSESYFKTNDKSFDKAMMWAKVSIDALVTTQDVKGIFAGLPWFNNNWGRDTFIALPGATCSVRNMDI